MAASSNTNRPLTPQMSNTFANALTRGLEAATSTEDAAAAAAAASAAIAAKATKEAARKQRLQSAEVQQRRMMLVNGNNTKGALVLLSPGVCLSRFAASRVEGRVGGSGKKAIYIDQGHEAIGRNNQEGTPPCSCGGPQF